MQNPLVGVFIQLPNHIFFPSYYFNCKRFSVIVNKTRLLEGLFFKEERLAIVLTVRRTVAINIYYKQLFNGGFDKVITKGIYVKCFPMLANQT